MDFGFKAAGWEPGLEWNQMMAQLSVWKKQANISNSAISNEPLDIETPVATDTAASCNVLKNHGINYVLSLWWNGSFDCEVELW